jgi:hypothetical protein
VPYYLFACYYSIGAILQAQIFDDDEDPSLTKGGYPEFDIDVQLNPELGGHRDVVPEHILNYETLSDNDLRVKLLAGTVPTVDTVYRFLYFLNASAKFSAQCNIISLIYLNRLTCK